MAATVDFRRRLQVLNFSVLVVIFMLLVYFKPSHCQLEIMSPSRILSEVEKSCVLVLFNRNFASVETSFANALHQIIMTRSEVTFGTSGLVLNHEFVWPDGQPLQLVNGNTRVPVSRDSDGSLVVFPKQKKDRKCLITGPRRNPKAELFTEPLIMKTVLNWVNDKCDTYISLNGGLTYQGLHRESILQNLFSMSHVSDFTMLDLNHKHTEEGNLISQSKFPNASRKEDEMIWNCEHSNDYEEGFCNESERKTSNKHARLVSTTDFRSAKLAKDKLKDVAEEFPDSCHESGGKNPGPGKVFPQCERLSVLPTKGQFFHEFLKISKPVILEGAALHWDAFHKWTMEFLREHYSDKEVHIKLAPDGLFEGIDSSSNWEDYGTFKIPATVLDKLPFPDLVVVRPATMNLKFAEFLDMISNVSHKAKPSKMYEGHIPEAELGYNRVSGQFRRKKLQDSTAMVMAPVDIVDPDFERFPAFAEARPLNCTINEGDVLFMPAFWWHEVQSYPNVTEGRNLAVNFWYEPFLTKEFPCAHCKLDVNPFYRHLL
ncbi:uncharacterized protein LOC110975415 isoform X2 [Acanthaster planci]|uniref:Uncharacterized protein LOC110975415 isoform X2 n=1 Tax=Acanthaster planci TaxID=133434 RepID=A0A8B7XRU7_ACAPL|nr:uncharacterized protein LOC110975415 isoform X2 [Acanthaster planci]